MELRTTGVFEQKTQLMRLLEVSSRAEGVRIYIGGESMVVPFEELSVVTAPYEVDGRIVGTGEVTLQPLNITEFCVEPGVRDWRKARWWCMGLAMSPQQAKSAYGLDWLPTADASAPTRATISPRATVRSISCKTWRPFS